MVFLRQLSTVSVPVGLPQYAHDCRRGGTIPGYWLHCQQVNITFCIDLVSIKPISIRNKTKGGVGGGCKCANREWN